MLFGEKKIFWGIFERETSVGAGYIAGEDEMADPSFGILADNVCWGALKKPDEKIYLITSASSGEGKTTVAVNLAVHIARRGKKVLLIDANLRNPALGELFDAETMNGLTQISCNGVAHTDLIFPVAELNIHFIPSGKVDHGPLEVFTSTGLKDFFDEIKKIYDFVVIDCASVNLHIDPLLLCSSVDQVIIVVLADQTEKSNVHLARNKILNAGGKILGVVLNRERYSYFINNK